MRNNYCWRQLGCNATWSSTQRRGTTYSTQHTELAEAALWYYHNNRAGLVELNVCDNSKFCTTTTTMLLSCSPTTVMITSLYKCRRTDLADAFLPPLRSAETARHPGSPAANYPRTVNSTPDERISNTALLLLPFRSTATAAAGVCSLVSAESAQGGHAVNKGQITTASSP